MDTKLDQRKPYTNKIYIIKLYPTASVSCEAGPTPDAGAPVMCGVLPSAQNASGRPRTSQPSVARSKVRISYLFLFPNLRSRLLYSVGH
jgi:hypothetical protein